MASETSAVDGFVFRRKTKSRRGRQHGSGSGSSQTSTSAASMSFDMLMGSPGTAVAAAAAQAKSTSSSSSSSRPNKRTRGRATNSSSSSKSSSSRSAGKKRARRTKAPAYPRVSGSSTLLPPERSGAGAVQKLCENVVAAEVDALRSTYTGDHDYVYKCAEDVAVQFQTALQESVRAAVTKLRKLQPNPKNAQLRARQAELQAAHTELSNELGEWQAVREQYIHGAGASDDAATAVVAAAAAADDEEEEDAKFQEEGAMAVSLGTQLRSAVDTLLLQGDTMKRAIRKAKATSDAGARAYGQLHAVVRAHTTGAGTGAGDAADLIRGFAGQSSRPADAVAAAAAGASEAQAALEAAQGVV